MRESKPLVQTENALHKISQVERMAVLEYIERKFRLFTYTEPAKRFFINKIIVSITMNTIKIRIFLKRQAFMDIFFLIFPSKKCFYDIPEWKRRKPEPFYRFWFPFQVCFFICFNLSIHYSISPVTFYPNEPGIGYCISIGLSSSKIPAFGNRSSGRKNMNFQWRVGLKKGFTSFPFQELCYYNFTAPLIGHCKKNTSVHMLLSISKHRI